jgi:hypothetical protein
VCYGYLRKAENPAGKCPSGARRGRREGISSAEGWTPLTEPESAAAAAADDPWRMEKPGMCRGIAENTG